MTTVLLADDQELVRAGLKRGDRIAIWLPNCPRWVELALARARAN